MATHKYRALAAPTPETILCRLLAQLQASEHDKLAAHLYRSRWEYRLVCQRAGKSGKQIERCVIDVSARREPWLQRRPSPMGALSADWRLKGADLPKLTGPFITNTFYAPLTSNHTAIVKRIEEDERGHPNRSPPKRRIQTPHIRQEQLV